MVACVRPLYTYLVSKQKKLVRVLLRRRGDGVGGNSTQLAEYCFVEVFYKSRVAFSCIISIKSTDKQYLWGMGVREFCTKKERLGAPVKRVTER